MSLLSVQDLSKLFGGLMAVRNLSFEVNEGEIVGLIGPNGAGKTTTFNLLSGFLVPTGGKAIFDGRELNGHKPHEICAWGLTRTFQIVQPFPDITAFENILIGAFARYPSTGAAKRKAQEVLAKVGLSHKATILGKNLTLMELKRLEIGKALATEPKMLLLDEVASGLNPVEVEEMLTLVQDLNAGGITFLLVEHVMQVIMNLSQRVVVLSFGEKIAEGTPGEISHDPQVLASYLGEEEVLNA
jgi:branched-chain amino acid transport system ATP-binding protein